MAFPDWVLKHKAPRTEIRCIKGKYYIYKIASKWNKETKKPKKITLGQIGVITEADGLIPTGMSRKGKVPQGESKIKNDITLETNFMDRFEKITDPRAQKNSLFSVAEIFFLTLAAITCGAEGWKDIEIYGKHRLAHLRKYFPYKNGIPSDDTTRRFFRSLNPIQFKQLFSDWAQDLAEYASKQCSSKVIAIDGKSSRGSYDGDNKMIHTVSAFATKARLVLGQEKITEKSNEITAIPKLLSVIDIKNHIITIDAMGCQYKIANDIIEKQGDYIFSLKGNQSSLHEDIQVYLNDPKQEKYIEIYEDLDKGHGRIETRKCYVCTNVEWLYAMHPQWQTIKSIIKIDSKREIKEKVTEEARYYISSLNASPQEILKAIRSHWEIENSLHWVLDVSFNEDYSRIRKKNAPEAMVIARHIVLNLLRPVAQKNQSIAGLRKICAWDSGVLDMVLKKDYKSSDLT